MLPIKKIQKWLEENSKDIFLINRTDEFLNEYIAPYAERLNWISNFSGSAGRAIIEKNKAYIFIDGRYTIQAVKEVDSDYFITKHLKDYWPHIEKYKSENLIFSVDAKLHSINELEKLKSIFQNTNSIVELLEKNPIDLYWDNQPSYPKSISFVHEEKYAGESATDKINKIQNLLKQNSIDFYLLNSLDSIAWLINLRGNDIKHIPLIFSKLIIPKNGKIEMFVDSKKVESNLSYLNEFARINSFNYLDEFIKNISKNTVFGFDQEITSYHYKKICKNNNLKTIDFENPCLYLKAQKNSIELDGARKANHRDGVSVTKFLYWLKNKMIISETNEIKAADYLYDLRKQNYLFHSLSFDTISAIGSNAALPHYRVSKDSNLNFSNNTIYLFDSGGQYKDGTTDITRTIIIGNASKEQKDRFTRVLKGHIAIAQIEFEIGTRGSQIDSFARKSLLEIGCDYDHGTGHGIGSFLSVHEGPQRIAKSQGQSDGIIKEGMIISNEPGYYKLGEYGIRIENLIIAKKVDNSKKIKFETISWAPIDKDLIDISLLNNNEKDWINAYHQEVYKIIAPYLNTDQKDWLLLSTSPL